MEILDSLRRHRQKERASFHMPGHKNGAAFLGTDVASDWLAYDVTELDGTDCLCRPTDAILRSEEQAAWLYGAARAFYLVNGASCGILSMFYAFFREGDSVLVDRAGHRSVGNALALCGLNPVYLAPSVDPARGVPLGLTAEQVRSALRRYSEVKGVFITSPNYYGMCSEIAEIARAAHDAGIPLLVDEAHGAHFPFDARFPQGAVRQGADVSVVSLHKSLPCPNQTALLLLRDPMKADEMQAAVNLFQTTSPSYPLMIYIEAGLDFAAQHGRERTDLLLEWTRPFRRYQTDDPFKMLMSFEENGIPGRCAEQILREEFGIYAELCDRKNVLLMASWGNSAADFELLAEGVRRLASMKGTCAPVESAAACFSEGRPELSPRAVRGQETEWVSVRCAAGRVSAGAVTAFPPCIPVLLPGERITKEQADVVCELSEGQDMDGVERGAIRVIKEK